jgi:hypothetical protein
MMTGRKAAIYGTTEKKSSDPKKFLFRQKFLGAGFGWIFGASYHLCKLKYYVRKTHLISYLEI